jgi:hypothetical protein
VLLRLEFADPRVLQVAGDRLIDQSWRETSAVCTNRGHDRYPLSATVLAGSRKGASLVQLSCEDSASLLQLANEEALLIHVVYIVSTYLVFLYFLTNDGEVCLIVTSGVSPVTCGVDGVEISGIKPALVSCHEARGPVL